MAVPTNQLTKIKHTYMHVKRIVPGQELVVTHQKGNIINKYMEYYNNSLICRQDFADSLDLVLNTCYDHSSDLFVSKSEVHIQRESGPRGSKLCQRPNSILCHSKIQASAYHTTGVFLGGIHERGSPYSVKLINIGQHTPLTNPGYSRQTSDGNFFNY